MQATQKQQIEMYQRAQQFLALSAPPQSAGYSAQKAVLDDVVAKLAGHADSQATGRRLSRAETARTAALRRTLRQSHLAPISKIARATLRDMPGIDVALKLPSPDLATTRLIVEAQAIRKAIAKYEPAFVEAGRPADFLAQLDAAIDALRQSILGKAGQVGAHIGARSGIVQQIRRGRKAVDLIDTMMQTAYASQPDILSAWRNAIRVQLVRPLPAGVTADENAPAAPLTPQSPTPASPVKAA